MCPAGCSVPLLNEIVDRWQLPQSPVVGCSAGGRVTIVTPTKDMPASWQLAQGIGGVTAGWFIVAPAKLEYCVGMWHNSQAAPAVGMCVGGKPLAEIPLWHVAQPLMTPL